MAVVPGNETERLRALQRFKIEGAGPDLRFDRIASLASELFRTPIALVSLVDEDQQWFKANCGFPVNRTDRASAFCSHAILSDEPLVVPDTRDDPRFADNPFVRGAPYVRFYAGVPLTVAENIRLGALCIMGHEPRTVTEWELEVLKDLAGIVVDKLRLQLSQLDLKEELERREAAEGELKWQKLELWKQERLLQQSSRLAHIGGWEYRHESGAILWSDEVYRIHELPRSYAPKLNDLPNFYPGQARDAFKEIVETAVAEGRGYEFELPFVSARGTERWVRAIGEVQRDEDDKLVRLFGSIQDITEIKQAQERIEFLAERDPLTQLMNRAVFQTRLDELLTGADSQFATTALVLIDVDHFKDINDTLGHQTGDALIQELARRISSVCRESDCVARLGGDEFAVILPGLDSHARLDAFADTLVDALCQSYVLGGHTLTVSASIGIVTSPQDGDTPDELLRNADIALYAAKAQGRNCYVFFSADMRLELERRQQALASIRSALIEGELEPFFQPVIALGNGGLIGFEALLRWVKSNGIVAAPGAYTAALHDPVLSEQIGTRMIQAAIAQIAAWQDRGLHGFRVGVNIAASQFRRNRLARFILDTLREAGVDPNRLAVEVTETVLLSRQSDDVARTLRELHEQGVRIALDDFGTGYASLTHLRDFPVDTIKIDRSFIMSLLTNDDSRRITQAIVGLSHSLGKQTIAEGVESVAVGTALRQMGCDWAQGYAIGRPMPGRQAELFVDKLRGQDDAAAGRRLRSVS